MKLSSYQVIKLRSYEAMSNSDHGTGIELVLQCICFKRQFGWQYSSYNRTKLLSTSGQRGLTSTEDVFFNFTCDFWKLQDNKSWMFSFRMVILLVFLSYLQFLHDIEVSIRQHLFTFFPFSFRTGRIVHGSGKENIKIKEIKFIYKQRRHPENFKLFFKCKDFIFLEVYLYNV